MPSQPSKCARLECSQLFTGKNSKKYCSHSCGNAQWREDNAERWAQMKAEWKAAHPEKSAQYYRRNREKVLKRQAAYYKQHPDKAARQVSYSMTRQRRGVTAEEFAAQLKAQGNLCPIGNHPFGDPRSKDAPVLDHDHVTELNRSIICRRHNSALGFFKDSPNEMRDAVAYVVKWKKTHLKG